MFTIFGIGPHSITPLWDFFKIFWGLLGLVIETEEDDFYQRFLYISSISIIRFNSFSKWLAKDCAVIGVFKCLVCKTRLQLSLYVHQEIPRELSCHQ